MNLYKIYFHLYCSLLFRATAKNVDEKMCYFIATTADDDAIDGGMFIIIIIIDSFYY